jgi:hypothetical protein
MSIWDLFILILEAASTATSASSCPLLLTSFALVLHSTHPTIPVFNQNTLPLQPQHKSEPLINKFKTYTNIKEQLKQQVLAAVILFTIRILKTNIWIC